MKNKKLKKALIVIAVIILGIFIIGYSGLKYLQHQLEEKITGCEIENRDFYEIIPFDYVSNWIIIKAKIPGSKKEFPFIFDTGAQTVITDLFLKETGKENFDRFTFTDDTKNKKNAFNNELISIHQLKLGNINFKNIGAISAKSSEWEMLNCVFPYGIIGYNIIQTFYSQINYDTKQIILTDNLEKIPNYEKIQWIDYKPLQTQETPIIESVINDSIKINLLFDTGNSGGIVLNSNILFDRFALNYPINILKYTYKPSLQIRGESNDTREALEFGKAKLIINNIVSENINITVNNTPEREFAGLIGNKYLENFIITLDYKNKRIGFIPQKEVVFNNRTFGLNYRASKNKITISSVFDRSQADSLGIKPGDKIYSINGIKISDLKKDDFCSIYRNEYNLQNHQDTSLIIGIFKNEKIVEYRLTRYMKFQ